ncbi:MAG: hypothetical protein J7L04_14735 [Bacteroidales bacterium]|nr:hypothetical protein [Bacteroidales bacterium]
MKILFLLFSIFFWQLLPGQEIGKTDGRTGGDDVRNDLVLSEQYQFVQALYDSLLNTSNEILNGREYEYYFYPQISSPLIPTRQQPSASIVINGKKYENITLQYDTYKDLLVYFDPANFVNGSICPVSVNSYIIDEFNIKVSSDNLKFRYLEVPEVENLKSGFYEIVYDGESQFIIKHLSNKFIDEGRDKYEYNTIRYVVNNAGYFKIKGKRSLLKALPDHSTEVKKYIKSLKISVRKANKYEILSILRYYDSYQLP